MTLLHEICHLKRGEHYSNNMFFDNTPPSLEGEAGGHWSLSAFQISNLGYRAIVSFLDDKFAKDIMTATKWEDGSISAILHLIKNRAEREYGNLEELECPGCGNTNFKIPD